MVAIDMTLAVDNGGSSCDEHVAVGSLTEKPRQRRSGASRRESGGLGGLGHSPSTALIAHAAQGSLPG